MQAVQYANKMIMVYQDTNDLAKAYEQLDGLSYIAQSPEGRTRQQALSLFHTWLDLKEQS